MPVKFTKDTVFDGFLGLTGGVNSGWIPFLLPNDQLSFAWNGTVRGGFITHRPGRFNIPLEFRNDVIRKRVTEGNFQGASFYSPDNGQAYLVASISGRLFSFDLQNEESSLVQEITISAGTLTTADFSIPGVTGEVTIDVVSTQNIFPNAAIEIALVNFTVKSVNSSTSLTIANVDGQPGTTVASGTEVTFWDVNPAKRSTVWMEQAEKWLIIQDGQSIPVIWDGARARRSVYSLGQIQAGKMMEYHRGRLAKVNPDGKTYSIGDIVYGSSGTVAENFRDAVLYVKENNRLAGGGYFGLPGNYGEITFLRAMAEINAEFGQGPLMVGTRKAVFSVNLPIDRTVWQTVEDPIQKVALVANGGKGQNSTINVNSDLYFRSVNGVRTLIQAMREFSSEGGNTPVSREMNRIVPFDDTKLLSSGSAVYFDNRMLMTCSPSFSQRGVFHRGLLALDFDVLSSMRAKERPVWDGLWTGVNTLQILTDEVGEEQRCMEFVVTGSGEIQLWELSDTEILDNREIPIKWRFETSSMFRKGESFHELDLKRLFGGELFVQDIRGRVDFRVYYKPDTYPCWVYWHSWYICADETECVTDDETGCVTNDQLRPTYSHRMPFGQPPDECNTVTGKPFRIGRTFQVKVEIIGHCVVNGLRLIATTNIPEPVTPELACSSLDYDTPGQ